jgi:serine/threonine protein kinase
LDLGQVLRDRYVLQARLGTGHRGAVFKALDRFRTTLPEAHQYVALKILHAGARCSEETLAELRLAFHCAQRLSHRNIVNVYELDRDGDLIFFTMEALDGEPLSQVIKRLQPGGLGRSQAWELIRQLGAGLAHAHERGIVHGDLKPENIFITREGELRILNFGTPQRLLAAKLSSDPAPADKNRAYASCEQLEGRHADPRDDLYALACVSYELLTGIHPFGSRSATLARDYRVSLGRPDGLTGRQWRALQQGLAWHRGGRSISVRAWTHRLIKGSDRKRSLTPLQDLAKPHRVPPTIPWRAAALVAVMSLATAVVAARLRSAAVSKANDDPSPVLSMTPSRDDAAIPPDGRSALPDGQSALTDGLNGVVATQASVFGGKDSDSGALKPRGAAKAMSLKIAVEPSQVTAEDHFAEIRLHRDGLQKNSSFTWWTEPATAKAGVDYAPEAVAIQTFPAGYRTTRLYVRLLPHALRSQRSYFYIAIAQPGAHQTPASVIRRQIWLPTSSSLQAQR